MGIVHIFQKVEFSKRKAIYRKEMLLRKISEITIITKSCWQCNEHPVEIIKGYEIPLHKKTGFSGALEILFSHHRNQHMIDAPVL